jgi:hypothetical protein
MGTPVPHPTSRAFLAFKIRCVCAGPGRLAEYDRSFRGCYPQITVGAPRPEIRIFSV